VIHRHPNDDIQSFTHNLSETLHYLSNSKLPFLICGDINSNLLQQDTLLSVSNYVNTFKYVLSTMGVSKESITKFLIGNRFHIKLGILSPYSNRFSSVLIQIESSVLIQIKFYLNKDWECIILHEIDFLLKICWSIPCLHQSWKVHTWIETCASLNHRKKMKADGSRLITRKHTETLVLLGVATRIPTRITTTSSTLTDHIYTNLPATKLTPGIIINDLSDHLPVFVSIKSKYLEMEFEKLLHAWLL